MNKNTAYTQSTAAPDIIPDLKCYSCLMAKDDLDRWCLTNPTEALTVNCPYNYCSIIRHELADKNGKFTR